MTWVPYQGTMSYGDETGLVWADWIRWCLWAAPLCPPEKIEDLIGWVNSVIQELRRGSRRSSRALDRHRLREARDLLRRLQRTHFRKEVLDWEEGRRRVREGKRRRL